MTTTKVCMTNVPDPAALPIVSNTI